MLAIKDVKGQEIVWHVGKAKPLNYSWVPIITADGEELEHIRAIFPMLTPCKTVAVWRGMMAELIMDNL